MKQDLTEVYKILKYLKTLFLLLAFILVSGCASQRQLTRPEKMEPDPRAVDHFVDGVMYDGEENFPAAMLAYHEALVYDPNAADLYLALGRDYFRVGKDETAYFLLKRVQELAPEELEALELLGRIYINWRHYSLAEGTFHSIIKEDSTYLNAYYNLGLLYLQRNDRKQATRMFEQIRELESFTNPQVLLSLGDLYLDDNEAEKALSVYYQLTEQEPFEGVGYLGMGIALESLGDTAKAVDNYARALHLSPDLYRARDRLAALFIMKNRWDKALQLYQEAWAQDTTDINNIIQIGEIHREKGDTLAAFQAFEEAKTRFPEDWRGYVNCGRLYLDGQNFETAFNNFKKAAELTDESHLGWVFAGVSLVHMDSLKASIPYLKKALAIEPNDPLANYYLGSTLDRIQQSEEAIPYLNQAIRIRPTWITAITALASTYDNLKQYNASDSLFQIALRLDNENPLVLNNYGYSLSIRGQRLDEAMTMVKKALELDPDNGAYLDTVGWIHYQLGEYETALKFIQKATELEDKSWTVVDHLGDVLQKLGKSSEAVEAWQKALTMDPGNNDLLEKINQSKDK